MTAGARFGPVPAMPIAVLIACAVHGMLIAAVGARWPELEAPSAKALEMMVVTQPSVDASAAVPAIVTAQTERRGETAARLPELAGSSAEPNQAETTSQTDINGGPEHHSTAPDEQAATEQTSALSSAADRAEPAAALEQPAQPQQAAPIAPITAVSEPLAPPAEDGSEAPDAPLPNPDPNVPLRAMASTQPEHRADRAISAADIFASRDAEMTDLAARIQEQRQAYANRARRKAISTATREYIYANYMEAWRRKVERIGNLNYPREARELGLFGSLILHVAVRSDGSLEGIRVVRSSGHEVLDQAAIRIVELAAPFAPFPPSIKREADVLDITRTWQFQRNHQLGWNN
jgi:protein TonB